MGKPLAETTHILINRELVLYKSSRSEVWQCRYKIDHKWLRASTREYKFDLACHRAKELLIEAEIRKRANIPIVTRKFKDIAILALDRMQQEKRAGTGKVIYTDYMIVIEKYFIPFFGNRMITNINYQTLDEFDEWRLSKMKKMPTQSTLMTHNAALNRILDEAVMRGYLNDITRPKLEAKGKTGDRRPAFDIEEVKKLIKAFEGWPEQGKNQHLIECRFLLRDYVFCLLDTGARPGIELFGMKWKQIEFALDFRSVVMRVNGKTGARQILGMERTITALKAIADRNYSVKTFDALITLTKTSSEFIFRTPDKINPIGSFQRTFSIFLKENGLLIDPITEQRRVFYSLRHTYATFALTYDHVPIHTLAKQMGTSVGMIEKHYSHLKVIQAIEQLRGEKTKGLLYGQ
jgi:integrase